MKKILVITILLITLVSCNTESENIVSNLVYDTLNVSKLCDSIIKKNIKISNSVFKDITIREIMYNNFYKIYNNTPVKFTNLSEGYEIKNENNKLYYGAYFTNEFKTKDNNTVKINIVAIVNSDDAQLLLKDSLYIITGDFKDFINDEYKKPHILNNLNLSNYTISFPTALIKTRGKMIVPFTLNKFHKHFNKYHK